MTKKWSIAEAKAHFSRVVAEASDEAQLIENRGVPVAVVVGSEAFDRLYQSAERSAPGLRLTRFLELSRALRRSGGAEIGLSKRESIPSPFSARKR
jgi:prevent-host-death family protein